MSCNMTTIRRFHSVALFTVLTTAMAPLGAQPSRSVTNVERRPIAVLLRHSVWVPAVNAPLFVLYDDGTALYPQNRANLYPTEYLAVQLLPDDAPALLATVGIGCDVFALDSLYDLAPNTTDLTSLLLYVWRGDSLARVAVRAGELRGDTLATAVPEAFKKAYAGMMAFQSSVARPWHPKQLEVAAWPYEYAPDNPPVPWPKWWPSFADPATVHQVDDIVGEVWRIRLPFDDFSQLRALLEQRRAKQAILISGHKVAATYRLPFPGEERWRPYIKRDIR